MDEDPVWHVYRPNETHDEIVAATWWVSENGDLLLGSVEAQFPGGGIRETVRVPSRAFAAGRWTEVVAAPD